MSVNEVDSDKLFEQIKSGAKLNLIDVRTPAEYDSAHIEGSKNIPLGSKALKAYSAAEDVVFICQGGVRAKTACSEFLQNSKGRAQILAGGIKSWEAADLPLIRGKASVSMERQVRIAAGLFVLVGTILGIIKGSVFFIIPAFVGAGLIYSGVTDTCGMALVLAKMPWNKPCGSASSCGCK